jgi:ubiquinone/menaquinone biosynthesis C-methylase UbiE
MNLFGRSPPAPPPRPASHGVIDVLQFIEELTDREMLESADQYFAGLSVDSEQCQKPFSNVRDAGHITRNLGMLFEGADLFPGADVLDFGCATGWLTLAIANLGCNSIGVDISAKALELARQLQSSRSAPKKGTATFICCDGNGLPVPDESVDRVLCFDSFHHVKDQRSTLKEFARVLRQGGRVVMVEPGPNHSKTKQSQEEMRRFKVIENDIAMRQIAQDARSAGLEDPQMLVQFQRPLKLSFDEFEQWSRHGIGKAQERPLIDTLSRQLTDTQCFFICKGTQTLDSRSIESLGAQLRLVNVRALSQTVGLGFEFIFSIRNTGSGRWLTGEGQGPGTVKLGIQLMAADGQPLDLDFLRAPLPTPCLNIGEEVVLPVKIDWPDIPECVLRVDLVSEYVAWFSQTPACAALEITFGQLVDRLHSGDR